MNRHFQIFHLIAYQIYAGKREERRELHPSFHKGLLGIVLKALEVNVLINDDICVLCRKYVRIRGLADIEVLSQNVKERCPFNRLTLGDDPIS